VAGGGNGGWAAAPLAITELQGGLRQSVQQVLKDQLAEQRRFMLATFEAFARRMGNDVKDSIGKIAPPLALEPITPEPERVSWWPVAVTALLAAVPAVVLGTIYLRAADSNRVVAERLGALEKQQAALETATRAAAAPLASLDGSTGAPAGPVAIEYVPYGETPLAGPRLERLRTLANSLESQGFNGRIVAETFVGDFCLAGSSTTEAFSLADPATPLQKCDLMGNPFEDSLSPAQRQSIAFANFASTLRRRTGGAIEVDVESGGRASPIEYPEQRENTTAGEWNRIATLNNRVEFRTVEVAAPATGETASSVR
jgi:hypothetical protein